jgi:hypothetical protein
MNDRRCIGSPSTGRFPTPETAAIFRNAPSTWSLPRSRIWLTLPAIGVYNESVIFCSDTRLLAAKKHGLELVPITASIFAAERPR